jgi:hypothetical protein
MPAEIDEFFVRKESIRVRTSAEENSQKQHKCQQDAHLRSASFHLASSLVESRAYSQVACGRPLLNGLLRADFIWTLSHYL